jgi:hypothetical protein
MFVNGRLRGVNVNEIEDEENKRISVRHSLEKSTILKEV